MKKQINFEYCKTRKFGGIFSFLYEEQSFLIFKDFENG